jgi:predicted TIM-barrel fold metal-dependent hydrolase
MEAGPVVDAHVHCFDPRFPYHPAAPYRPEAPATVESLLDVMDGAGVDFAVVVQAEPYQDDHACLEHCLDVGRGRLRGTCLFFADRPDAPAQMRALARRGDIVAARIHAYAPERMPPFGKPELRRFWKEAADLGLVIQLHFEPRAAPGFEPLIREFARTPVIVDHLGRPLQGSPEEFERVLGWARFDNVHVKLSEVPPRTVYPHRDAVPYVRRLLEAFGADRMLTGGGFGPGATGASYRAERERLRSFVADRSEAEQAMIFGGTAMKLFRLAAAPHSGG